MGMSCPTCGRWGAVSDMVGGLGLVAENDKLQGLLLWALYHHQGANSPIGQPIRKALGIGENDNLTEKQVTAAQIAAGVR